MVFVRQRMQQKDVQNVSQNGIARENVRLNIEKITNLFVKQFMRR